MMNKQFWDEVEKKLWVFKVSGKNPDIPLPLIEDFNQNIPDINNLNEDNLRYFESHLRKILDIPERNYLFEIWVQKNSELNGVN